MPVFIEENYCTFPRLLSKQEPSGNWAVIPRDASLPFLLRARSSSRSSTAPHACSRTPVRLKGSLHGASAMACPPLLVGRDPYPFCEISSLPFSLTWAAEKSHFRGLPGLHEAWACLVCAWQRGGACCQDAATGRSSSVPRGDTHTWSWKAGSLGFSACEFHRLRQSSQFPPGPALSGAGGQGPLRETGNRLVACRGKYKQGSENVAHLVRRNVRRERRAGPGGCAGQGAAPPTGTWSGEAGAGHSGRNSNCRGSEAGVGL